MKWFEKLARGRLFSPRTKRVAGDEKGSIVLVAMLLFMALISTGLLTMRHTQFETAYTGSLRLSKVTLNVAEAGLLAALAKAAQDPEGFVAFLQAQNPLPPYRVSMADISTTFFDTSLNGSFGQSVPATGYVNWLTELSDPVDTNRMPGFSLAGFCFKRFRWRTQAEYGPFSGTVPSTFVSSQKVLTTYAFVGPLTCKY